MYFMLYIKDGCVNHIFLNNDGCVNHIVLNDDCVYRIVYIILFLMMIV